MYRQSEKNINVSSRCPHNTVNFGPLTADICWGVWSTYPCKFQRVSRLGFASAATSLTRDQPNFARCLAVSWTGALYIHFRGLLPHDGILPVAIFTLRPSLAFSYIVSYCTYVGVTARHSSSGHQSNFAAWYKEWNKLPNFRRGRHLYLAGRPSRWASAVILVTIVVLFVCHNCSYCDFVTTV